MATDHVTLYIGDKVVASDTTTSQYKLFKPSSTAGQVKVCAATTDVAIGVLYNKPEANMPAKLAAGGIVKMLTGGTIGTGVPVGPNSTGVIVAKTTDGDKCVGLSLESATSGDVIPVAWAPHTLATA